MEIILADSAGFCFGVEKAVNRVYDEIKKDDDCKINTFGEIIHNKTVTNELMKKGVVTINDSKELDLNKKNKVIIRAHGVPLCAYSTFDDENIEVIDCTCPFVKKIHKIVEKVQKNQEVIIIGSKNHPEIIGIKGYAKVPCHIIEDEENAKHFEFDKNIKYVIVVQTTLNDKLLNDILCIFDNNGMNYLLNNTICAATTTRQKEAKKLAAKVDIMLVIGDKSSSNSTKLYEICSEKCSKTHFIETMEDLHLINIDNNAIIGVTAGASTPQALIKEAIKFMSNENEELSFAELFAASESKTIHKGKVVKGNVIGFSSQGEAYVDINYKVDGVIPTNEVSTDPNVTAEDLFEVGQEIEVQVVSTKDDDGNVILSTKRVISTKDLEVLEDAYNNKTTLPGTIVEIRKGGASALINGVKVFVPMSQISSRFVKNMDQFKGREFDFNIIEFNKDERRFIASRRELAQKEEDLARAKALESLKVGDKVQGTVSRVTDFGAFVDLGGIDGLVHISELAWTRVKRVTDVLNIGDTVDVFILDIDEDKSKVALTLKDLNNDPWKNASEKYIVGDTVTGTVARIAQFGAFVNLEENIDGLLHISQISNKHVKRVEDVLEIGQTIEAVINEFDLDHKKISLSMKELEVLDENEENFEN